MGAKLDFFNSLRNVLRRTGVDRLLPYFTAGKGYDNFFVKCAPQNYQYPKGVFRKVCRNGIWYSLDLSEYMEWVIYFDLSVEHRNELYPLVKRGMKILDVGGNIGETAMNFARLTGEQGWVISFEPVPDTFRKFQVNAQLNEFANLKVEQMALSDKNETLYFDPATYNNSGGIYMRKETQDLSYSAQAVTLDDFVHDRQLSGIDFVKIDVEGFEFNVLKGAVNTLRKMTPVLFVEINDHNLQRQNSSSTMIFDLLAECGYRIYCEGREISSPPDNTHYDIVARQ
ncbi:MAG: FkbM family methyltransferase [Bacteroidia bacterium]